MAREELGSPEAKLAHLDACLRDDIEYKKSAGFSEIDFINEAACSISLAEIDISKQFAGKHLRAPLMIAPMTGGIQRGAELNRIWALAAEKFGIALGVGSQRIALEDPLRSPFYQIRKYAPTALLFGNLGAAQLCQGFGPDEALAAVEMIQADALFIHLNAIQEACQGKEASFAGIDSKIAAVCGALHRHNIPVFAREVCFGLSPSAVKRLIDAGVQGIDCSGAGGTSWAKVEAVCAKTPATRQMASAFGEWGIPTVQSIKNVRQHSSTIPLIASGGIRSGLDAAKALALGADIAAMARPILLASVQSEEELHTFIDGIIRQLRVSMFGVGAKNLAELNSLSHLSMP